MNTMAEVAQVPSYCSDFLNHKGVLAAGGKIIKTQLGHQVAEAMAYSLNKGAHDNAGKYIVIR